MQAERLAAGCYRKISEYCWDKVCGVERREWALKIRGIWSKQDLRAFGSVPGDLPDSEIEPASPALKADSLLLSHHGNPFLVHR